MIQRTHFPQLDALRTLACLAVFLLHSLFLWEYHTVQETSAAYRYGLRLFELGTMGVNFFFVLSGFLITYLLLEEESRTGRLNVPAFYLRRVLRIWPLYFLSVAVGFGLTPWVMQQLHRPWHEEGSLPLYLTFLANFDLGPHGIRAQAFNLGALWSVAIEEQFYLFWPLLLLLFRPGRAGVFLLLIGVSLAFRYAHAHEPPVLYQHTLAVVSDLAVGGAAGWACFRFAGFRAWLAALPRWAIGLGYALGLGLIFGQRLLLNDATLGITVQRLVRGLFFAFVLLEQSYGTHSLFKVGHSRWLTYWGQYTYGFYCLHPIALYAVYYLLDELGVVPSLAATFALTAAALPLSAGLAWLSYRYWELPFLRLKNRVSTPPAPAAPGAPALTAHP